MHCSKCGKEAAEVVAVARLGPRGVTLPPAAGGLQQKRVESMR